MEFLKDLFSGGSLTYDQLSEAAKGKGVEAVAKADADNLRGQVTTLTTQLTEASKKLEGYDPTWKEKAETAQRELDAQAFSFALEKAVAEAKPRNAKAVTAMLDREKLSFAGGEVIGLDKQLDALRKGEDTAFLFEEAHTATAMSHQNGREGTPDKKDEANAALRSIFGKEG